MCSGWGIIARIRMGDEVDDDHGLVQKREGQNLNTKQPTCGYVITAIITSPSICSMLSMARHHNQSLADGSNACRQQAQHDLCQPDRRTHLTRKHLPRSSTSPSSSLRLQIWPVIIPALAAGHPLQIMVTTSSSLPHHHRYHIIIITTSSSFHYITSHLHHIIRLHRFILSHLSIRSFYGVVSSTSTTKPEGNTSILSWS